MSNLEGIKGHRQHCRYKRAISHCCFALAVILALFMVGPVQTASWSNNVRVGKLSPRLTEGLAQRAMSPPSIGRYSSQNWSGYFALTPCPSCNGGEWNYNGVGASWTVPDVVYANAYSVQQRIQGLSIWVGIGGGYGIANNGDTTLIQMGTSQDVGSNVGEFITYPWYEMLPAKPVILTACVRTPISNPPTEIPSCTIKPDDEIEVQILCIGAAAGTTPCSPQYPSQWKLVMTNYTRHWIFDPVTLLGQAPFQYQASWESAEWIVEAPQVGENTFLPLAGFAPVKFLDENLGTVVDRALSVANNGVQMSDPFGGTASPCGVGKSGTMISLLVEYGDICSRVLP